MGRSNKITALQRAILKRGLSALVLLSVLCVAVYAGFGRSLGWFSENHEADAEGMNVAAFENDVDASVYYRFAAPGENFPSNSTEGFTPLGSNSFNPANSGHNLLPGSRIQFKIEISNKMASHSYKADVKFAMGAEEPHTVDTDSDGDVDEYYYFGTQMKMRKVADADITRRQSGSTTSEVVYTNHGGNLGTEQTWATITTPGTDDIADLGKTTTLGNVTASDINIVSGLELPAESTVYVYVTVEYVNLNISQDVYQDFVGECTRNITVTLSNS